MGMYDTACMHACMTDTSSIIGGLIGMMLASSPGIHTHSSSSIYPTLERRLSSPFFSLSLLLIDTTFSFGKMVLNDVGGFLPVEALRGIASYVGKDPKFKYVL